MKHSESPQESSERSQTLVEEREVPPQETFPQAAEDSDQKYKELYEQYVRLAADFDNYRKRQVQEQEAFRKYGAESSLRALIPVLDNLERASGSLNEASDPKLLYQSFKLVYNQLLETLASVGLQKMEAVGKPFDPNYHEAVAQVENNDYPDHTVTQEHQSGFMLQDRVLRPAMVIVSVNTGTEGPQKENPFKNTAEGNFSPEAEA